MRRFLSWLWAVSLTVAPLITPLHPTLQASSQAATVSRHTGRWLPPLGPPLRISGPYLAPPGPYASGHRGIDLPAQPGALVVAPVAGTVSFVGMVADRGVLSIRVDDRTVVSLEPIVAVDPATAAEGDTVERGEQIGVVATGGHCLAECMHLGVRVDGAYVHPRRYFFDQPILLPW